MELLQLREQAVQKHPLSICGTSAVGCPAPADCRGPVSAVAMSSTRTVGGPAIVPGVNPRSASLAASRGAAGPPALKACLSTGKIGLAVTARAGGDGAGEIGAQIAEKVAVVAAPMMRRVPEPNTPEKNQPVDEAQATAKKPHSKFSVKKLLVTTLILSSLAVGAPSAHQALQHFASHEETDDAYITGHLHQVSTRVNGTVEQVLVDDNEHVKQGQVLVLLDPRDYQVKVNQVLARLAEAERKARSTKTMVSYQDTTAQGQDTDARGSVDNAVAAIARAQAQVREAKAAILESQADLVAKQAELERAEADYHRYFELEKEGAISTSQRDSAKRDYVVALGNRDAARNAIQQATERLEQAQQSVVTATASLTKAKGQVQLAKASAVQTRVNQDNYQTDLASIEAAKAALDAARLDLSYTKIVAPIAGRVGKKTVERGQRIEPGEPLLTLVSDDPWVVANYKETQIKKMRSGQQVEITIDAIPEHKFRGSVLSFSPASGSSFAVLPSDNATGNFTKIVQRVPVKIVFSKQSVRGYEDRLSPGLSVVTSVDVANENAGEKLAEAKK